MNMHVNADIYGDDNARSALLVERSEYLCIIQKNNSHDSESFRDYENINQYRRFFSNEFSMTAMTMLLPVTNDR